MHAGWNSVVRVGVDRLLSVLLISITGSAICLVLLPFTPFPPREAWPFMIASLFLHVGYKLFLARAYRFGDLAQVYPIARGTAPLITAIVGASFLNEPLTQFAMLGLGLLVSGIFLLALRGGRKLASFDGVTLAFAFGTSLFIAAYTLVDGQGARLSQSAGSFITWLMFFDGVAMTICVGLVRSKKEIFDLRHHWKVGFAGGGMSLAAYWITLWAMTKAPIAVVAALRETSVLFATIISVIVLKEPLTPWRIIVALIIFAGVACLRLA